MKNRNLAKVLVLVLSLALLIGSVAAINVSAETEEIAGVSIVHGAKIQIAIAANAGATVTYKWGAEGETLTAIPGEVIESTNAAVNGKTAYLTEGVAYYELGKVCYINVNGEEITYSVAQFLFAQLYRDKVDGTAGACYKALLALGDASQIHLDQNASALPSKSTYAYTNDANITINGDNFAFAPSGEATTIAIAYNGSEAYTGFQVGSQIFSKSKAGNITIDGICEISLYTDPLPEYVFDFDSTVTDANTFHFATYAAAGKTSPKVQTQIGSDHTYQSASAYYGALANLVTDPAGSANQVLKVVVNNGNQNSNVGTAVGEQSLKLLARDPEVGGTVHIVEYDLYVERINKAGFRNFIRLQANGTKSDGTAASTVLQGGGTDNQYNGHNKGLVAVTGSEKVANAFQVGVGTTQSEGANYALLDSHTWYRLRYVYDFTAATMRVDVSVDGGENWYLACKAQSSTMLSAAGIVNINSIDLQFNCYSIGGIYYVDNVDYTVLTTAPSVGVSFTDAVEHPAAE